MTVTSASPDERTGGQVGSTSRQYMLVLLVLASFLISLVIELRLFDLRVFSTLDTWFQADANEFASLFANPEGYHFRHPIIGVLIHPPIALAARVLVLSGITDDSLGARTWLALLVVPLACALRTFAIFHALEHLVNRLAPLVLLCVIDIAAAATVTIGSVPESYPLTAALLALMFWLVLDDRPRPAWFSPAAWTVLGTLAMGVTLTNVLFVIALAGPTWFHPREQLLPMIRRLAVLVVAMVGINAGLAVLGARVMDYPLSVGENVRGNLLKLRPPTTRVASELAWAVGTTFLAPTPRPEEKRVTLERAAAYSFFFSYAPPFRHGPSSWYRALATVVLLVAGFLVHARHRRRHALLAGVTLVLAASVGLHLIFGTYFALYALHWEGALLMIMAGVATAGGRWRVASDAALLTFTVACVVGSSLLIRDTLSVLAGA